MPAHHTRGTALSASLLDVQRCSAQHQYTLPEAARCSRTVTVVPANTSVSCKSQAALEAHIPHKLQARTDTGCARLYLNDMTGPSSLRDLLDDVKPLLERLAQVLVTQRTITTSSARSTSTVGEVPQPHTGTSNTQYLTSFQRSEALLRTCTWDHVCVSAATRGAALVHAQTPTNTHNA